MPTARDGQRVARLFRQARDLKDVRAPHLEALAEMDGLEICEFRGSEPGCTAVLLRLEDMGGGGILLEPGQNRGRRRFSIAHELGHYHIPRHAKLQTTFSCLESDMRVRETDPRHLEWEANDFAAELLMPSRLFGADAGRRDISFASVEELAGEAMYDVSMTAAAWRLTQTVADRCALVVSTKGRVTWIARSSSLGLPLIERDQRLDPNTLAAAAFRAEGTVRSAEEVPWHSWFASDAPREGTLLESTHRVEKLDQVLSLLWFIEGGGGD